jgi:hypothetical protein
LSARKICCQVCGEEYDNESLALKCAEDNGYPEKPKYQKGQIVEINNKTFKKQKAKVVKFEYAKPSWISAPAHKLIYLLILPSKSGYLHLTTEQEENLSKD